MKNTIRLLSYFVSYILPAVFALVFTAWTTTMPNLFDWIYQCPSGVNACTVTLYCVVFSVAYVIFAILVGVVSELIERVTGIRIGVLIGFNRRRWTPKIDSQFDSPSPNNLTLYLTSSEKKDVYIQCVRGSLKDTNGNPYPLAELNRVEDRPPNDELIKVVNLTSNKPKEPIPVGISHNDKIALSMDGRHLFGFRDGMYEYAIVGRAKHVGIWFDFVSSAWLTFKDGALVKISDTRLELISNA